MKRKRSHQRFLTVLCVVIFALFILYYISPRLRHESPPVITVDSDMDQISVELRGDELTEFLMTGVTASDREDGDVTDSIIIESFSSFDSKAIEESQTYVRTVTYVAFDSAKNVTKYSRRISYTDYRSPVITADSDMVFTLGVDENEILSHLHCVDVIDGDISGRIALQQNNTIQTSTVGTQTVTFEVTNSCGDTAYLTLDIEMIS